MYFSEESFTSYIFFTDDSFSIEALSESFEEELKQNPVHFAICAIYKSGVWLVIYVINHV